MTDNMQEAGIHKAALVVASLDPAAADRLLERLPQQWAGRVRQAVMEMEAIDAQEQQRVIEEFRRIGPMIPDRCPPGIELDHLAQSGDDAARLALASMPGACYSLSRSDSSPAWTPGLNEISLGITQQSGTANGDAPPFGFLCEAEEEKLSQLLGGERPQTVALVLSHLPPERAGEVLARFPPPLQVEVVRRLLDLENADPDTLREVEQALETRLARQFAIERSRTAGPKTVERILAACPNQVVGRILTTWRSSIKSWPSSLVAGR